MLWILFYLVNRKPLTLSMPQATHRRDHACLNAISLFFRGIAVRQALDAEVFELIYTDPSHRYEALAGYGAERAVIASFLSPFILIFFNYVVFCFDLGSFAVFCSKM